MTYRPHIATALGYALALSDMLPSFKDWNDLNREGVLRTINDIRDALQIEYDRMQASYELPTLIAAQAARD